MTTTYAQKVYCRARREVAERGFITEATTQALYNLGHSAASVAGLEADYRDGYPWSHREKPNTEPLEWPPRAITSLH